MTITRISRFDTGGGPQVRMDAGSDGSIVLLTTQASAVLYRLEEDGVQTGLVQAFSYPNFSSGIVETLSDGRYVVGVGGSEGFGNGARVQVFNRDGSEASALVNPEFDTAPRHGPGFVIAATQDGGFAFTWNDFQSGAQQYQVTHGNGSKANYSGASDVRIRYFDGAATATTASAVADEDVETISTATINRRAADQYLSDAETLSGGATVWAYVDNRVVGSPDGGGSHLEWEVSVQISTAASLGEPIKVDLGPYNEQFGTSYPQAIDVAAGINVVALSTGGFAVIWTENLFTANPGGSGYTQSGWTTLVRYYDAAGTALTAPIEIVSRDMGQGNITKYVWAEPLPDGKIAIAYADGLDGANGNGTTDAFLGVVGPLGASIEVIRANGEAATNSQFYSIEDMVVRTDGTIELSYRDAANANHTVVERFAITGAGGNAQVGGGAGETLTGTAADEVLFGFGGNDTLAGNGGIDALHGGEGDDHLNGGTGADRMFGYAGNDVFTADNVLDKVVERSGGGLDTVRASVSYTLGEHVENLILTGGAAINGNGNALGNSLTGSGAANRLDGKSGADAMAGGLGHDVYVVDNLGDSVTENGSSGSDTVESSVDFRLPTHVEKLILTGTAGRAGRGNSGDNNITGNSGANTINGSGGDDVIDAGGGNDLIYGSAGKDSLKGGAGLDRFLFNTALGIANVDKILDFHAPSDTINLDRAVFAKAGASGTLSAAAFRQGSAAGDASDRIVYEQATGKIYYDADGTGALAQILFATVTAGTALTNADFVIYG